MVMTELGLPPGFTLEEADLQTMVRRKTIRKFEIMPGRVVLYLDELKPGAVESFTYTLKPKYPLRVQIPPSAAYEYYTPSRRATVAPAEVEVRLGG